MMAEFLHLITLVFLLAIIPLLAENISIDCGTNASYVDSNNVTWVGDNGFVTTGVPLKIPDVVTKPINTLRYFPTGQTNCYTIPVSKRQKILVRTKYYYQNYDGKSTPPSFNVVYDGKHRDSLEITESLVDSEDMFYFSEVVFIPANENISVCLFRTSPSDNPFISSIEVYSFDDGMYGDLGPNEGLIMQHRTAYGATESISYPLDPYGRLWSQLNSGEDPTLTDLTTSAPSIDITRAANKPPEIVLSKAVSGDGLILSNFGLPLTGLPIYMALYFSELESLDRTQKRSFNVFLDNAQVGSSPIVPVFGKATQVVLRDVVATSESSVVLKSTDDSVVPPLINGMELYFISNSPDGGGAGDQTYGGNPNGGPTKRAENSKVPIIVGVISAVAFLLIVYVFIAITLTKRRRARLQALAIPPVANNSGTGASPLFGQQMGHDSNEPANEAGMGEADDHIEMNQSYY